MYAGRDFTADDRRGGELVAIVSQSIAQRVFPTAMRSIGRLPVGPIALRQAGPADFGVAPTVDDENIVRGPA